jgi:hypothetical protein
LSRSRADTGWSWSIGLVALALLVMAIVEFARPGSGETVDLSGETQTGGPRARSGIGPPELHQLLPDPSADLGRAVQVAGAIIGQVSAAGFWVRDLRVNIVFIRDEAASPRTGVQPRPGATVRVRGLIELFPPDEQDERLRAAGLVLPAGTSLVREIKIRALDGGIEILRD